MIWLQFEIVSVPKGCESMNIPFGGNVSVRLLRKLYKNKVFYYVGRGTNGRFAAKPCVLSDCGWDIDFPFVRVFKDTTSLDMRYNTGVRWRDMFDGFEQAKAEARRRNHIYFECFKYEPYLELDILQEHLKELMYIEEEINKCLVGFENFEGIDFCDVHAGGIQIRGHHKQIKGHTYGSQPTVKYDFSNIEEVISDFIDMWRKTDRPQEIAREQRFIEFGEKYGWN